MNNTPLNILILDDESSHVDAICRAFMKAEKNVKFRVAGSLREYREHIANELPDLAMVDLNLPDGHATEVLTHPPEAAQFPVLVMTAFGNQEVVVEVMKAGALDYVVKSPRAFSEMPETAERVIREWNLLQERKRNELALRWSEAQLNGALESTANGILAIDIHGKWIKTNRRFAKLWQIPESILNSQTSQNLLSLMKDQLCEPDEFLKKMQVLQPTYAEEMETLELKDSRIFEFYCLPMLMEGQNAGWVLSFRDISARKRAATEHEKLQAQFAQAQKMETIGRLAGGVAHDFNNLLSVILGYTGFVTNALPNGDPLRADLAEIKLAADRAVTLTQQLLAFSRKQILRPVPLDLNKIVHGMEKMLLRVLGEDIAIVKKPAPDLGLALADPGQIEQVILNLLINARDAMVNGGIITIETANAEIDEEYSANLVGAKPGSFIELTIADSGCGMDEQIMAQLFEPFFTTKEKGKGTGLGLSTALGIIQQSGGNIQVTSAPGQGSTFRIFLPRVHTEQLTTAIVSTTALSLPVGTETILVVEDEESLRNVAQRILAGAGYTVITVTNGKEALQTCEQNRGKIHLILTDVIMPEMNGRELADHLAKTFPAIKILFMSGYTDDILAQQGVLDFETNLIAKPFTQASLLGKIRQVLDYKSTRPDDSVKSTVKGKAARALDKKKISRIPPDVLARLRKLVIAARSDEIIDLIETIRTTEPEMATGLRQMADLFDYDGLRIILSSSKEGDRGR
jgi:two-component system cell cycle sensor histidine kinase/response regulator CckA